MIFFYGYIFALIAAWPAMNEGQLRIWPIPISFIFLFVFIGTNSSGLNLNESIVIVVGLKRFTTLPPIPF